MECGLSIDCDPCFADCVGTDYTDDLDALIDDLRYAGCAAKDDILRRSFPDMLDNGTKTVMSIHGKGSWRSVDGPTWRVTDVLWNAVDIDCVLIRRNEYGFVNVTDVNKEREEYIARCEQKHSECREREYLPHWKTSGIPYEDTDEPPDDVVTYQPPPSNCFLR